MGELGSAGRRYRFGVFEADAATGELWRKGVRVRIHAQPFQVLTMLLDRPGEVLTREEICRKLWPDGTFVDFEHGVNSAVNRLREALGDRAANPRFVETLARRGYRFVAPVERIGVAGQGLEAVAEGSGLATVPLGVAADELPAPVLERGTWDRFLAQPEDLPKSSHAVVRILFLLLQGMYLGFYVGALANLPEVRELLAFLPGSDAVFVGAVASAALLIPVRVFLLCAVLFRAPGFRARFLRAWWVLLGADVVWALSPFLLLHHISFGLALACVTVLVYSPFAQRSLVLMGAGMAGRSANLKA